MLYTFALYCSLGSPAYEEREAASDLLCELVRGKPWDYGPRLVDLARGATDPEIYRRVQRPVAIYQNWVVVSYVPKTVPVWPACDMLPMATPWGDVRCKPLGSHWLEFAAGMQWTNAPYWHSYRRGTERMVRQLIRDGASYAECDALLARMWAMEQLVRGDSGDLWVESVHWTRWEGGYPRPR
jgi:hypothetical protein